MSRRAPRSRNVLRIARVLAVFVAALAVSVSLIVPAQSASAVAAQQGVSAASSGSLVRGSVPGGLVKTTLTGFKAGNIISDDVFTNDSTLTATQIQSFLNSKVKTCRSGYTCLKDLKIATQTKSADKYCSGYQGSTSESAARIIYKVAKACDINPQVLIVMLQKEQGLVTHTWPSDWRYNAAMGQACPDTAPCNVAFAGFFAQVYGAARQMQIYMDGVYFTWYAPGKTWNILYHPNSSCGRGSVYVANKATSALYYYTPYQPNAAALKAGYGTGNSCSSYGNRNFYNYFTDWFGSTQSTVCAPPSGGTSAASNAYVVTAASSTARSAPRSNCKADATTLSAGDIVRATTVSGSGLWLEVKTEVGLRWILREDVRKATSAEDACTIASGTSGAKLTYTVTSSTSARLAPRSGCDLDAADLAAGSSFTASSVTASGTWLKLTTAAGERWVERADVRKATSAESVCAFPSGASTAKYAYVIEDSTLPHLAPKSTCDTDMDELETSTVVQAKAAVDGWLAVETGQGVYWIDRDDTRRATTAETACVVPSGVKGATKRYVSDNDVTTRNAPRLSCASKDSVEVATVLQATAVTEGGDWLRVTVDGASQWVSRDDVRYATAADLACVKPSSPASAKYSYVITATTTARYGASAACGSDATLTSGQAVRAVASVDGWLKVVVDGTERWIDRTKTRRATSAELACVVEGTPGPASKTYLLSDSTTGRSAATSECALGATSLSAGRVFTANALSPDGKWLRTTIDGTRLWVPRSDTQQVAAACVTSTTGAAAKYWYKAKIKTTARLTPAKGCTTSASTVASGSLLQATAVSSDGLWLRMIVKGETRWVLRADLVKVATKSTTTDLNLRSSASTSATVISTLPKGTRVAVLATSGAWKKVQTQAGTGWVKSSYLQ